MKIVKNGMVGMVVEVPTYCFAPNRSGWNGYTFAVGIIREVMPNGSYKVEYPSDKYNHTDNKRTYKKVFGSKMVFEYQINLKNFKYVTSEPRSAWYDEDLEYDFGYGSTFEFLIDNGILADPEQ